MGTKAAMWRIARPTKDGVLLTGARWDASAEEKAKVERLQREFADKLAQFMRDNGYSGEVITPWPLQNVTVKRGDA